jgi:hypothetical protein
VVPSKTILENIMLGVYLYNKLNIKEVLFVNFLMFVAKWAIWKFRNDIKYNNKKINTLKIKQMLKIELKSNTALITKSPLLNKNIGKLLFEILQTKLPYIRMLDSDWLIGVIFFLQIQVLHCEFAEFLLHVDVFA